MLEGLGVLLFLALIAVSPMLVFKGLHELAWKYLNKDNRYIKN